MDRKDTLPRVAARRPPPSLRCIPRLGLQTRGERLTQEKKAARSSAANPPFDLKQTYDIVRVLGEGGYGMVYHALRRSDGKAVALKAMPREYTGQTDFEREVAALQLLRDTNGEGRRAEMHRPWRGGSTSFNYMTCIGTIRIITSPWLVEGGELFDHLIAGGPFSEGLASSFLRQFAEGISFTHQAGLVHADLKPENLLLTKTEASDGGEDMSLKVVDFGCACPHDTTKNELQLPAQEFAHGCSFLHMVALETNSSWSECSWRNHHSSTFVITISAPLFTWPHRKGMSTFAVFLVAKGARINRTDRWGGSPLDDAHRHKHLAVIQYLREQGAKFGNTATAITRFIEAASAGDVEEAKALLEFGGLDMNQGDYDRRTALHLCCSEGKLKMVELLLQQEGVDVNVEDRWGNRPLDDALRAKHNSDQYRKAAEEAWRNIRKAASLLFSTKEC
ncbi:hypothetical protein ACHAXT_013287 [Thalassiosira profunda]